MSPSPPPPAPLPRLMADLIDEILLRLPPSDPGCLFRASLVCKPWRSLLTSPAFARRYRAFHRTPPLLGFLHSVYEGPLYPSVSTFFPTAAFAPPQPVRRNWYALDSRHGRVLFHDFLSGGEEDPTGLVVWDPVTDAQRGVPLPTPLPESANISWNAAVLCAAEGCDHLDCHGGPFLVAYIGTDEQGLTSACVYSSEAGAWSEATPVEHPDAIVEMWPSVLVGNTVYFPCEPSTRIMEYDIGEQELMVINAPYLGRSVLVTVEDGVLGFAGVQDSRLYLWSRECSPNDGAMAWARHRVIELETVLPIHGLSTKQLDVVGFADGVSAIFIRTDVGVFTIELNSGRVKKVSSRGSIDLVFPYMSYYTPDHARDIMSPPLPVASSSENIEVSRDDY